MPPANLSIGVDGGGTKTELILCDASGNVLARHNAPGCNPSHAGPEQARATLDSALAALTSGQPGRVGRCALYLAGAPAFWREYAVGLNGYGRVSSDSDALPVLELATGGAPGLVLHSGTGSFIAARGTSDAVHYAGGLGWKLGDPGSGFELGRRGATHALLELQGWAATTGLGAALQKHTGLEHSSEITRFFYSDPAANARLAAFAPMVLELAESGCAPAREALQTSLADLAQQAELVLAKLFPGRTGIPCGICGSILNRASVATQVRELAAARRWPVKLHFITDSPIEGVRRLLLRG